jgi:hypothetical protein
VLELELPPPLAWEYAQGDERLATTLAQALKLGLARERYVDPGEVEHFVRRVGHPRSPSVSLVFHDQLPGGTGYLPWLQANLPRVARRAWEHLDACPCEQSCYRCLREFWNQREHDLLDKRLVFRHLLVLAAADPSSPPVGDLEEAKFDSFLETAFWRLAKEADLALPVVQRLVRSSDGRRITTADFAWGDVLVFVDGYAWHGADAEQAVEDQARRSALAHEGKLVLEFAYEDVVDGAAETITAIRSVVRGEFETATAAGAQALEIGGRVVPVASHDLEARLVVRSTAVTSWTDRSAWRSWLEENRLLAAAGLSVARSTG